MKSAYFSVLCGVVLSSVLCGCVCGNQTNSQGGDVSQEFPYGVTSMTPPSLIRADAKLSPYRSRVRIFQGVAHVERSEGGRLWAAWMASNSESEKSPRYAGCYNVIATSADDGKTWKEVYVFDPSKLLDGRSADPLLWKDSKGKIRLVVTRIMDLGRGESDIMSAWEFTMGNPDSEDANWSAPRFLGRKNMSVMKPIYLSDGTLLRPTDNFFDLQNPEKTRFVAEDASGKIIFESSLRCEGASFSEQSLLQRKDGSIISLVRMCKSEQKFFESRDGGRTWQDMGIFEPKCSVNVKAVLFRLNSGNVLLVANDVQCEMKGGKLANPKNSRAKLTAFLSEDDGKTFPHKLLLDGSNYASYPSITQSQDGRIYIAHDRGRFTFKQQSIILEKITEDDIKAGKLVSDGSELGIEISNLHKHGGGLRFAGEKELK